MRKSKRGSDDVAGQANETLDALEREIQLMHKQIDAMAQSVDMYVQRIKQLEDERTRLYAAGISARVAEISATAIGKTLPTIGTLARRIGDITTK